LRSLRRELADAADLPPYVVFSDRSLVEMAACFPQSPQSFLAIHGVGQRKLTAYGERFLAVIRVYCAERGLAERPGAAPPPPVLEGSARRRRWQEVGEAFAAGASAEEQMALYSVKQGAIVQHLARYVYAGNQLDPSRVRALSALEQQEQVIAQFARLGTERLSPVFEALGGAISYDELHLLRTYCLCRAGESSR
jgi:ATP-dependent DNA helicase RecQ